MNPKHRHNLQRENRRDPRLVDRPGDDGLAAACAEYAEDQAGAPRRQPICKPHRLFASGLPVAWKRQWMTVRPGRPGGGTHGAQRARHDEDHAAQMVAPGRTCRHRGVRALIRIAYHRHAGVPRSSAPERAAGSSSSTITQERQPRASCRAYRSSPAPAGWRCPGAARSTTTGPWRAQRTGSSASQDHDIRHTAASEMVSAGGWDRGGRSGATAAQTTKRYAYQVIKRPGGRAVRASGPA